MWSYSSSSQASPVLRPRVEGDAVIIGKSTVLARRVERLGCWEVERHHPVALSRLLSMAYGKRISVNDPMVKLLEKAATALPRDLREADHLISGLPAPLPEAEDRIEAASRLLKDGVSPSQLETALRGEKLGLRPAPAWAERLTLCEKGVVLGKATVIVGLADLPYGGTAFDLKGKEAEVMALLSVARRGLAPSAMLTKLATASRALAEGDVVRAAIVLAQTGQPALTDEALAKSLDYAANKLKRGMRPLELLKISGLVRRNTSTLPWFKGAGEWNEDDHPRQGEGAENPGWFAEKGSDRNDSGIQTNPKQANDDKAFPYRVLRLSDGSEVIGYNGRPICIPNDVSLSDNVKLGEVIGNMPPDVRPLNMAALFSPKIGLQDYQRTHSSDELYNRRYIDFGNFNYGAVAAAAGYSEENAVRYAAYANQIGDGDKSGKYGGNPRNEVMIRAGWHTYHDDKIPNDSKRDRL